jgi:hypothetical protein
MAIEWSKGMTVVIFGHIFKISRSPCREWLTGKAFKTINLIFQKILFWGKWLLFKMNLSKL